MNATFQNISAHFAYKNKLNSFLYKNNKSLRYFFPFKYIQYIQTKLFRAAIVTKVIFSFDLNNF